MYDSTKRINYPDKTKQLEHIVKSVLSGSFFISIWFLSSFSVIATDKSTVMRFGFAEGRNTLESRGWYADNKPESGHATDFEDHYDFSRITIGLMNNFIRAYLWNIENLPGVSNPGRITFRLRRKGNSSKIILQADGQGVCTYLQKDDPEKNRYLINGGTNKKPIYWGNDAVLNQWHDYTLIFDGKKRRFIIDNDPATEIELKVGKSKHKDHLSLGMGYEYGKEMYIDIESLRFDSLDANSAEITPPQKPNDGPFTVKYGDGRKWIRGTFKNQALEGKFTRWHKNGQKKAEGRYVNGKPDGEWIWWYPDGRERLRIQYDKGLLHGQYVRYYPSGQLETTVRFTQGKVDGLFLRWFPEGNPEFIGGYKNGEWNGYWAKWNRQGQILWAHMSANGKKDIFVKTWYPDGTPKYVEALENGVRHGFYIEYEKSGKEKTRTWYEHGTAQKR